MKQHLDMLKTRREYFEKIASERVARELEAEETEKIRVRYFYSDPCFVNHSRTRS